MDYDEGRFPALAAEALRKADIPATLSAWNVLEWTLRQTELPRQRDVPARFGEPPITLFSGPRFHVDVYFWFHGTTSMHQHAFCGAFQVLLGSSIHSWYDFERREAVNSFCEIGDIKLRLCELLKVGDVQEILPGRQYVHSLFHLDQPSATIVARTDKSPLFLPQFDYHKPSLATDPFFEQDTTTKKLQSIGALLQAERPDADAQISELLGSCDFHTTYLILANIHRQVFSNRIEQQFGVEGPRQRFGALMSAARKRHGERAEVLARVFAHNERIEELVRSRSFVTEPEHRFFFALLLNAENREQIFSLIRQRFPEAEPLEKILDWAYELSQVRIAGSQSQNALGIAGFDDFDLLLLEHLLNGKTDAEIVEFVRENYPPPKAESLLPTLAERTAAIRNSIVFAPLLGS